MAPPGRPNDPPDRRRSADRDPDDWDWGDEEWDEVPSRRSRHARSRSADAVAEPSGTDDRRRSARDRSVGSSDEHEDEHARDDDAPRRRTVADGRGAPSRADAAGARAAAVIRRRRLLAGGGVLLSVLLVVLVISAVASGGEDEPQVASVPLLAAPMKLAATASADHLERAAALDRFAEIGEPVYCGAGEKPWVALTYDDGPGAMSAKWIALLSRERIPVTSFRVGSAVPGNERFVTAQRNLGWDSGTHTQGHPDLTTLDEDEQRREIVAGIEASARVLGRRPQLFRPPYQAHNATTDRILSELGQVQVLWNVDTQDSLGPTTVAKITKNAIEGLRPGAIILMHETKDQTFKAMPAIIAEMRKRDLEPVTVSKMLAGDPPSEQQLRQGFSGCNAQQSRRPGEENRPGEVGGPEATT